MSNIKTVIRGYYFDTRNMAELATWEELKTELEKDGLACFETWGNGSHYNAKFNTPDGVKIELETAQLFNNQWNTAPIEGVSVKGWRVFDWAQDYPAGNQLSKYIKRGHYLEQTEKMVSTRKDTHACGYCGHQEKAGLNKFCPKCIGSEYLERKELHLLRMQAVQDSDKPRAELTDEESALLVPQFVEAQTHGHSERDKKRIKEKRESIQREREKRIENANTEADGMLWLMDNGVNVDNVIFYNHTQNFCFGWRKPLDADVVSAILDIITEFPFSYEIKTEGGKTLQGTR